MFNAMGIWAVLSGTAHGFCGTYVGVAGTHTSNEVSRVVYVRDGDRTTLTLANDVVGDPLEFGLLIPVPEGLTLADVQVVSPDLINAVDAYSAPRLVSYTCEDVSQGSVTHQNERWEDGAPPSSSGGCGGSSSSGGQPSKVITTTTESTTTGGGLGDQELRGVSVEEVGAAGEYWFELLSATDGGALGRWADDLGFEMDRETAELLDEYVQNGSSFLAARVSLEDFPLTQTWLSPIQISYQSDMMTLPLRLGTTASSGIQDTLLFVIGDNYGGWVGISNYDEVPVESECLFDGGPEDLGDWYDERVTEALQPDDTELPPETPTGVLDTGDTGTTAPAVEVDPAGWVVEYAWGEGKCDPCPTEAGDGGLDEQVARDLGWTQGMGMAFFTRIHMRYGPEQVDQDLVLYQSHSKFNSQMRYVQDEGFLRDLFPVCGEGFQPPNGECLDFDGFGGRDADGASGAPARAPTRGQVVLGLPDVTPTGGRSWPLGVGLGFGLAGLVGFLRRFAL